MPSNNAPRGRIAALHLTDAQRSLEQARDSLKAEPGTESQTVEEFEAYEAVKRAVAILIGLNPFIEATLGVLDE